MLYFSEEMLALNRGLTQLTTASGWCLTAADEEALARYRGSLGRCTTYLSAKDLRRLDVALEIAYQAHNGQKRRSGEPYVEHPISVATVLAHLRMDGDTLVAGLLHDTVEDTRLSFGDIEACFGPSVRRIVEGETKVSKLQQRAESMLESNGNEGSGTDSTFSGDDSMDGRTSISSGSSTVEQEVPSMQPLFTAADAQTENLRSMLIAMSEDWRVLIVKLADRLHNMRTLYAMPAEKQRRIALETLQVFAPLAHRLGVWTIKEELEDRAFAILDPPAFRAIERALRDRRREMRGLRTNCQRLQLQLQTAPVLENELKWVRVKVRTKGVYNVWRNLQRKRRFQQGGGISPRDTSDKGQYGIRSGIGAEGNRVISDVDLIHGLCSRNEGNSTETHSVLDVTAADVADAITLQVVFELQAQGDDRDSQGNGSSDSSGSGSGTGFGSANRRRLETATEEFFTSTSGRRDAMSNFEASTNLDPLSIPLNPLLSDPDSLPPSYDDLTYALTGRRESELFVDENEEEMAAAAAAAAMLETSFKEGPVAELDSSGRFSSDEFFDYEEGEEEEQGRFKSALMQYLLDNETAFGNEFPTVAGKGEQYDPLEEFDDRGEVETPFYTIYGNRKTENVATSQEERGFSVPRELSGRGESSNMMSSDYEDDIYDDLYSDPRDVDMDPFAKREQLGLRSTVEEELWCYAVQEAIHDLYPPVSPNPRVKDYIAFPKSNGYRGLHSMVVVPGCVVQSSESRGSPSSIEASPGGDCAIEVQLRTSSMEATALFGMAATWRAAEKKSRYHRRRHTPDRKEVSDDIDSRYQESTLGEDDAFRVGSDGSGGANEDFGLPWLRDLPAVGLTPPSHLPTGPADDEDYESVNSFMEGDNEGRRQSSMGASELENAENPYDSGVLRDEFAKAVLRRISSDRRFVFTPYGTILNLPRNATVRNAVSELLLRDGYSPWFTTDVEAASTDTLRADEARGEQSRIVGPRDKASIPHTISGAFSSSGYIFAANKVGDRDASAASLRIIATKVNGRVAAMNHPLRDGDIVSMVTVPVSSTDPSLSVVSADAFAQNEGSILEEENHIVSRDSGVEGGNEVLSVGLVGFQDDDDNGDDGDGEANDNTIDDAELEQRSVTRPEEQWASTWQKEKNQAFQGSVATLNSAMALNFNLNDAILPPNSARAIRPIEFLREVERKHGNIAMVLVTWWLADRSARPFMEAAHRFWARLGMVLADISGAHFDPVSDYYEANRYSAPLPSFSVAKLGNLVKMEVTPEAMSSLWAIQEDAGEVLTSSTFGLLEGRQWITEAAFQVTEEISRTSASHSPAIEGLEVLALISIIEAGAQLVRTYQLLRRDNSGYSRPWRHPLAQTNLDLEYLNSDGSSGEGNDIMDENWEDINAGQSTPLDIFAKDIASFKPLSKPTSSAVSLRKQPRVELQNVDPMGWLRVTPETFEALRERELRSGRVAILGALAIVILSSVSGESLLQGF